jgi:hypothetical protein
MASLRQLGACIGLTGNFRVLRHFFGFRQGRIPPTPAGVQAQISLRRQMQRLQGDHFHLNVIAIGVDNFTNANFDEVDYSIYKIRNIYGQVGVGIGRVRHFGITAANAMGFDTPTTNTNLAQLTQQWRTNYDNGAVSVFIPQLFNVPGIYGRSVVDGPCQGDPVTTGMNASVAGLWDGFTTTGGILKDSDQTARSFAHEVGHYLNLSHNHGATCPTAANSNRLMTQTGCVDAAGLSVATAVDLTTTEGTTVKAHCLINAGCAAD